MKLDGLTNSEIMDSLNIQDNIESIFHSGEGIGKSGSFFFFTKDKKFVIKTTRGDEKELLLGMLDSMINHFKK